MKRYIVNGHILSEWTNKFLSMAEEAVGRQLEEDEVMGILDYAIGFISSDRDCAEQAADAIGLLDYDEDSEEE